MGVNFSHFDWTPARIALLREIFSQEGGSRLSDIFGLSRATVENKARELGIDSPRTAKMKANKESINPRYFLDWSPEMSYDLGNGFADGTVRLGRYAGYILEVSTSDEALIIGTRNRIGSLHKIARRERLSAAGTGYIVKTTKIDITHKETARVLAEQHGMLPNKSNLNLPMPFVPDDLLHHFSRGYLDGDGCVHGSNLDIPAKSTCHCYYKGSHLFIQQLMEKLLVAVPGLHRPCIEKYEDSPTITKITWASRQDLELLYEFLYPEGSYPFLPRKRSIFAALLQAMGSSVSPSELETV